MADRDWAVFLNERLSGPWTADRAGPALMPEHLRQVVRAPPCARCRVLCARAATWGEGRQRGSSAGSGEGAGKERGPADPAQKAERVCISGCVHAWVLCLSAGSVPSPLVLFFMIFAIGFALRTPGLHPCMSRAGGQVVHHDLPHQAPPAAGDRSRAPL
jgi:hypothetical protein